MPSHYQVAVTLGAVAMLHPSSYELLLPKTVHRNLRWPALPVTHFLLSVFGLPFAALEYKLLRIEQKRARLS